MRVNKLLISLSTLSILGYAPMPGTVASVATAPLIWALSSNQLVYLGTLVAFVVFSIPAITQAQAFLQEEDPSHIVIDELIGMFITFVCVPLSFKALLIGTLFFRIFDIFKPWPVSWCEKIHGPWGVVLDDVVAGLISNVVLQLLLFYQVI